METKIDIISLLNQAKELGMTITIKGDEISIVPPQKQKQPDDLFGKPSWNPTPEMLEVASWFNRRPSTVWSKKEIRAWKEIVSWFRFEGDEWNALKWLYTRSDHPFCRKDLGTLLNNWQGEIDRAINFKEERK